MEKPKYGKKFKLGMLGGGQLGRMFIQDAMNLDVHVYCLDPDPDAPCAHLATTFSVGELTDYDTVYEFGKSMDLLTIEIENVNVDALEKLEAEGLEIYPKPENLRLIQDKGLQKEFYQHQNLPTAPFRLYASAEEVKKNEQFPFVQKLRKGGYDGKGVQVIKSPSDLDNLFDAPCLVEDLVAFDKEISVIVARNKRGDKEVYPTVECEFSPTANLVEFLFSPANVRLSIENEAQKLALQIVEKLDFVGLLAVEFFVTKDGTILINEIAPRPHNSGHHTIEGNVTSQFEQHLRSILNFPLGSTALISPAVMINLLGSPSFAGTAIYQGLETAIQIPGVHVHLYGKEKTKPFRKMGHVTICNTNIEIAKATGRQLKNNLLVVS